MAKTPKPTKNSKSENESQPESDSQGSVREAIEAVVIASTYSSRSSDAVGSPDGV